MSQMTDEFDTQKIAELVIYELLGRRVSWPKMRAVEVYPIAETLNLTGRPVDTVEAITDWDGNIVTGWHLHSRFRVKLPFELLRRAQRYQRPADYEYYGRQGFLGVDCRPREVTITYTYGYDTAPEPVRYAISLYKQQLDLAIAGDSDCKLPERVTTVSRQGLTMTMVDPAEYLDKGRTGIPQIDSLITFMNPAGAKRRARLFTNANPPARRLLTEVADSASS